MGRNYQKDNESGVDTSSLPSRLASILKKDGADALSLEAPNPTYDAVDELFSETNREESSKMLNIGLDTGALTYDSVGNPNGGTAVDFVARVLYGVGDSLNPAEQELASWLTRMFQRVEKVQETTNWNANTSTLSKFHDIGQSRSNIPMEDLTHHVPCRPVVLGSGNLDDFVYGPGQQQRHTKTSHYNACVLCDPYVHMEGILPETTTVACNQMSFIDQSLLTNKMTYLTNNCWTLLDWSHVCTMARGVHIFVNLELDSLKGSCVKLGQDKYRPRESLTWSSVYGGDDKYESMRLTCFDYVYRHRDAIVGYVFPKFALKLSDWTRSVTKHDFGSFSGITSGNSNKIRDARGVGYELVRKNDGILLFVKITNGTAYLYTRGRHFYFTCSVDDTDLECLFRFEWVVRAGVHGSVYLLLSDISGQIIPEIYSIQSSFVRSLEFDMLLPAAESRCEQDDLFFAQYVIVPEEKNTTLRVNRIVTKENYDNKFEGLCVRPFNGSGSFYIKQRNQVTVDLDAKTLCLLPRFCGIRVDIDEAYAEYMQNCQEYGGTNNVIAEFSFVSSPVYSKTERKAPITTQRRKDLNPRQLRALLARERRASTAVTNTKDVSLYKLRFLRIRPDKKYSDSRDKIVSSLMWNSLDFLL